MFTVVESALIYRMNQCDAHVHKYETTIQDLRFAAPESIDYIPFIDLQPPKRMHDD